MFVSGFPDFLAEDVKKLKENKVYGEGFSSTLKDDIGKLATVSSNFIYYRNITTVTGQSGGPILVEENKDLYLIGIHIEYSALTNTGKGIIFSEHIEEVLF